MSALALLLVLSFSLRGGEENGGEKERKATGEVIEGKECKKFWSSTKLFPSDRAGWLSTNYRVKNCSHKVFVFPEFILGKPGITGPVPFPRPAAHAVHSGRILDYSKCPKEHHSKSNSLESHKQLSYIPDHQRASRKMDLHTLKSTSSMTQTLLLLVTSYVKKCGLRPPHTPKKKREGSLAKELCALNLLFELFCFYHEIALSKSRRGFFLDRPKGNSVSINLRPRFYLTSKCLNSVIHL